MGAHWLTLITFFPLLGGLVLLFVPGAARDTIRPLTNPNPLEENAMLTLIPSPTNLKLTEPESRNGPGVRPVALEVVRARKVFQSSPGLSRRLVDPHGRIRKTPATSRP